jgi:hypothetical protein
MPKGMKAAMFPKLTASIRVGWSRSDKPGTLKKPSGTHKKVYPVPRFIVSALPNAKKIK